MSILNVKDGKHFLNGVEVKPYKGLKSLRDTIDCCLVGAPEDSEVMSLELALTIDDWLELASDLQPAPTAPAVPGTLPPQLAEVGAVLGTCLSGMKPTTKTIMLGLTVAEARALLAEVGEMSKIAGEVRRLLAATEELHAVDRVRDKVFAEGLDEFLQKMSRRLPEVIHRAFTEAADNRQAAIVDLAIEEMTENDDYEVVVNVIREDLGLPIPQELPAPEDERDADYYLEADLQDRGPDEVHAPPAAEKLDLAGSDLGDPETVRRLIAEAFGVDPSNVALGDISQIGPDSFAGDATLELFKRANLAKVVRAPRKAG